MTDGATSGFPTVSWESARTASPIRAVRVPWFYVVPQDNAVKNRLHLDVHASGGGTTDRSIPLATHAQRVDAEATRLTDLGATCTKVLSTAGPDHHAVGMKDLEGNELDMAFELTRDSAR
jgi:hypothetical protein